MVPVSTGELVDKITILRIKTRRIGDLSKKKNIALELSELEGICAQHRIDLSSTLVNDLEQINEELWDIEDKIRDLEAKKDFGPAFVELARAVYISNDQRFRLKAKVNEHFGSSLREEKSYNYL